MGWFKGMVRNWLEIMPAGGVKGAAIMSDADFEHEVFRNNIWYRGNPAELMQFYAFNDDMVGNKGFWAAGGANMGIRKMHSGLPALIVDTISDIAVNELGGVVMNSEEGQAVWDRIAAENGFLRLLSRAVRKAVALGDGAFKISFDPDVSMFPIIEFFGADKLRFNYKRGRVDAVVFLKAITRGPKKENYVLEEIYTAGGIEYRLLDAKGNEVDLSLAEAAGGLVPIKHKVGMNLAVPLIFDDNPKFEGRGKSIFDGKIGAFDALDEVLSQWVDAMRDGRVQKYIPTQLLPRNPHTGEVAADMMGAFANRFILTEMDMSEGADNSIKVVQPSIDTSALAASVANFLALALQGIVAPATLGIDLKQRDNAEAQREKEKATLYTRARLINVLRDVIRDVAVTAVTAYEVYYGEGVRRHEAAVEFGEYAAPSFDSQIETIGRGRQMGVLSIEAAVDQLYGNAWSAEQKSTEVERLRNEQKVFENEGGNVDEGKA